MDSNDFGNFAFNLKKDEKLKRFKEIEELYDEIMKTVAGGHFISKESMNINIHRFR